MTAIPQKGGQDEAGALGLAVNVVELVGPPVTLQSHEQILGVQKCPGTTRVPGRTPAAPGATLQPGQHAPTGEQLDHGGSDDSGGIDEPGVHSHLDRRRTFGMNTPAYFAVDNVTATSVPEPSSWLLCLIGIGIVGAISRVLPAPAQPLS